MTKKIFLCLLLFAISEQAFAFHTVSEVLPNGKILFCKSYNEIRKGNVVEIYSQRSPRSRFMANKEEMRISEFTLPKSGQRIHIFKSLFSATKHFSQHDQQMIGVAIVSDENLEGQDRVNYQREKTREGKIDQNIIKIDKESNDYIHENCMIALPENNLHAEAGLAVEWE